MEDLDAVVRPKFNSGVSLKLELERHQFSVRFRLHARRAPREEPDGSRVIGGRPRTTSIEPEPSFLWIWSGRLARTPDNTDVAFLWNGINVDGVVGSNRSRNAFLEDDNTR